MVDAMHYMLFLIPMVFAFIWISRKDGVRQALLDLLAFNLMFAFDFAALLPNNTTLLLVHVLFFALMGLEIARLHRSARIMLTPRIIVVLSALTVLIGWMVLAAYLNRTQWWTYWRITTDSVYTFILPSLFVLVGIVLANDKRFDRFIKIFLLACTVTGMFAIVQTATGGKFSNYSTNYYLDIFQPLGEKAVYRRDVFANTINQLEVTKTIRFGNYSFYRGEGTFEGAYVILCATAIALLSLLTTNQRNISRWLFVPFFLSVIGFVIAFNRTALLTFAIVSAGVLIAHFRSLLTRRVFLMWFPPLSFLLLITLINLQPVSRVLAANLDGFWGSRAGDQVATLHGRTMLWDYVLAQIESNPVIGTGAPTTLYLAGWGIDDNPEVDLGAHNSFLHFALRGGLLPAVMFSFLFLFCLLRSFQLSFNHALSDQERSGFFALLAALVSFFPNNITGTWMIIAPIASVFWIFCGYLAAYRPVLQGNERRVGTANRAHLPLAN